MDIVFGILGRTALRIDGGLDEDWGSPRLRAMLATLLVHAGRAVPIDTLVAWVWPEDGGLPQNPASTFHTYATRIRKALQRLAKPPTLHLENGSYRLDVDTSLVDYGRFRVLVGQAREHARANAHRIAAAHAERALKLWRGRPLDDLTSERAQAWRTRVVWDEWLPANMIQIEALLELDEFGQALVRLDDLRNDYDKDVTLAKLRLSALYGLSRYAEATAYYLGMRRMLLSEYDELSAEDLREHHELLRATLTPVEANQFREPVTVPRQLPHDIPEFVGRGTLLAALDAATQDNGPDDVSRVVVLDGMAGVGKTALVVHWGHRARQRFPGGDFFIDLHGFSDSVDIAQAAVVDEFLIALGHPPSNNLPPRSKELLLKRLLAHRRALVVLDNARNSAHVKDIIALLPNCSVVVTSRQQLTQLRAATGARRVHVDPMTQSEATDLLSARLGDCHHIDPGDRALLAKLCGGLPLVISVLAEHIARRPAAHLAAFARRLSRRQLLTDIGEDGDGSVTAETFFYSSYRALGEPERRLFRLLGLYPGPDIDEAAARAYDGRALEETRRSLRVLVAAHLLDQPEAFDRYRFHDLIREFARHRVELDESPAARASADRRLLSHYLSAAMSAHRMLYPGSLMADDFDTPDMVEPVAFADAELATTWFDRERINLVAAIHLAANQGYHEYAWRLTDPVATLLDRQGFYEDSRAVRQRSVASAHAAHHRVGEASTLVGLGMVEMILGDLTAARSSLDAALHLVEADGNERGQAATLHQLGRLEVMRGNPDGAIKFYDRCLAIAQRTDDDEGLCWTHCRIAEPLRNRGEHDTALTHLHQCQFHAQRIGDESAHASSMVEMGSIYRDRGDHSAAIAHCERALRMVEDMPIPDRAVRTSAYIVLAEIHNEQHNTETSSKLILDAIELAHGAHNTTTEARAQEVYGDIQFAADELAGAIQAWRQAAEHYEGIGNVHRMSAIHTKINGALGGQAAVTTATTVRGDTAPPPAAMHSMPESRDRTLREHGHGHR